MTVNIQNPQITNNIRIHYEEPDLLGKTDVHLFLSR